MSQKDQEKNKERRYIHMEIPEWMHTSLLELKEIQKISKKELAIKGLLLILDANGINEGNFKDRLEELKISKKPIYQPVIPQ